MTNYKWYTNSIKLTEQRVRQIVTVGLPEIIKPGDVSKFGIIPFVTPEKPEATNLEIVVDDGIEVAETEATQKWRVGNKFDTPEEEQAYLDNIAAQEVAAQVEADNKSNLDSDAILNILKDKTMSEIDTYIDGKTTVNELKPALKVLAKVVVYLINK
jgi:hypothetical protein